MILCTKLMIILIGFQILKVVSSSKSIDDDEENDFQMLVAGGDRINERWKSTFMVSIRTESPTKFYGDNHICCGVIVADNVVITAALCVTNSRRVSLRTHRLRVIAGAPNRLKKAFFARDIGIKKIIPHVEYHRNGKNDIAALILNAHITIDTNDGISIAQLNTKDLVIGDKVEVLGWGAVYDKGPYAANVMMSTVYLVPDSVCYEKYPRLYGNNMLCASVNRRGVGTCPGDSGGPVLFNRKLIGISTWAIFCKENLQKPNVILDIRQYKGWLNEIIRDNRGNIACSSNIALLIMNLVFHYLFFLKYIF